MMIKQVKRMSLKWLIFAATLLCGVSATQSLAHAAVGTSIPDLSEWQGALTATEVQNLKKNRAVCNFTGSIRK